MAGLLCLGVIAWQAQYIFRSLDSHAVGNGKDIESYGFELSHPLIPIDKIQAFGSAKDSLQPLNDPPKITAEEADLINKNERGKYLVPNDRVIGVTINGDACAYPIQILNWHEIVNDTLGGVPIVVTYNPLCDSVVVAERRVEGDILTFGFSGLFTNSNPLYYDRRPNAVGESLWPQLMARAVTGPSAEKARMLHTLPASLIHWNDWRTLYPTTKVLDRNPQFKKRYKRNPYNSYYGSDLLRFPVDPTPPPTSANKTRIAIVGIEGLHQAYQVAEIGSLADSVGIWRTQFAGRTLTFQYRRNPETVYLVPENGVLPVDEVIYSFWFAWYAIHPDTRLLP